MAEDNSMKQSGVRSRLWDRSFILVLVYAVLCNLTMSVSNTVLPLYVVNGLGMSAVQSGLLGTIFTVGSCLCRFFAGGICDRAGYRRTMVIGAVMVGGALFCLGFSSAFALILLLKFIQGVGHSLDSTASNTAAADVIPPDRFADGISYYGLNTTIVNAIGPSISLALMAVAVGSAAAGTNYRLPLVLAGICGFAAVVLALLLRGKNSGGTPREARKARGVQVSDFIEPKALPMAFLELAHAITIGASVYMILYANARGYRSVSFYYLLSAAVSLVSRFVIGDRIDRVKPVYFAVLGSLLMVASYFLLGVIDTEPVFIVVGVLTGISNAILTPLYNSLALKFVPKHRGGAASATFWLGFDIGIAIGQVLFGAIIDLNGGGSYTLAFIVAGFMLLACTVAAYLYLRNKPPMCEIQATE